MISVESAGTLDGLLVQRVQRTPQGLAYRHYDKERGAWVDLSWADTARETARWQTALAGESLQPGDRVAVLLRNCPEWVQFDQASLGLGLVVVPLYTDDRPDNAAYIMEDAGVKLLLVQDAGRWKRLAPAVASNQVLQRVVLLEAGRDAPRLLQEDGRLRAASDWLPAAGDLRERRGDARELASIVYTSGTTGRPKGVMLSHHNILSIAHASIQCLGCYREDVFLSFMPLSHTLERTNGYYLPLMAGASVAYARSIAQLADDLQTIRPSVLIAVPRIFERVYGRISEQMDKGPPFARWLFQQAVNVGWKHFEYRQRRRGPAPELLAWPLLRKLVAEKVTARLGGRLRLTFSGGAALSPDVARTFIGLGLPILQGYGLTETSPAVSVNRIDDNRPSSVGIPLPGVQVSIGEDDELLVKGPGVMLGYWNNPNATADMIDSDGWLHTGDQVRIEDSHIYITGRIKDIVVLSNGEKVPPGDMETAMVLDPHFEQAMVVGEGKPYLGALVVLNRDLWPDLARVHGLDPQSPESLTAKGLHTDLLNRIKVSLKGFPGYAKVRRVCPLLDPWTVENGLLTPTLKVKRAKVSERYAEQIEALYKEGPG